MSPPQHQSKHVTSSSGGFKSDLLASRTPGTTAAYPLQPLPASSIRLDVWKQARTHHEAEQTKQTADFKLKVCTARRHYKQCIVIPRGQWHHCGSTTCRRSPECTPEPFPLHLTCPKTQPSLQTLAIGIAWGLTDTTNQHNIWRTTLARVICPGCKLLLGHRRSQGRHQVLAPLGFRE